jgi:hypothetical protein
MGLGGGIQPGDGMKYPGPDYNRILACVVLVPLLVVAAVAGIFWWLR